MIVRAAKNMGKYRKIDKTCPDIRCEQSRASQQHLCVCQPVVVQKHFHSKSSFLLYVCYSETVSSYNGSSVFGGKNNLIYEFFLPFRNLHRVVIGTQTQLIFDVLPGASRWSPRSRLHSLLKCLTFLGHSIHRFIFSYLNQLPSSMLVLQQYHQRISIFIIQIFIPMIFASKIALDIH